MLYSKHSQAIESEKKWEKRKLDGNGKIEGNESNRKEERRGDNEMEWIRDRQVKVRYRIWMRRRKGNESE